jgi:hypothetical protein
MAERQAGPGALWNGRRDYAVKTIRLAEDFEVDAVEA